MITPDKREVGISILPRPTINKTKAYDAISEAFFLVQNSVWPKLGLRSGLKFNKNSLISTEKVCEELIPIYLILKKLCKLKIIAPAISKYPLAI